MTRRPVCAQKQVRIPHPQGHLFCEHKLLGKQVSILSYYVLCLSWYKDSYCDMESYLLRNKIIFLSDSSTFWEPTLGSTGSLGPGAVREASVGTLNIWSVIEHLECHTDTQCLAYSCHSWWKYCFWSYSQVSVKWVRIWA